MMAKVAAVVVVALAVVCQVSAEVITEVKIKDQLKHFAEQRFPDAGNNGALLESRDYIEKEFERHGLRVEKHFFNTTVNTDDGDKTVEGVNIIGVAHGSKSRAGSVVLVGADYDTNGEEEPGPLFNNGAGVAALLETIRLFMHNVKWSGEYKQDYTTIFVAFDLNTKEHKTGPGEPGASHFMSEWLWPFLDQSDVSFGGAFILDSIMNLNLEQNTQEASQDFRRMFPQAYNSIFERGMKGDFLGLVTQSDDKSIALSDQFYINYSLDKMMRTTHIEKMTIPSGVGLNQLMTELTTQDTMHFWSFNDNGTERPLPAVLLTDTAQLRMMPENPCGGRCPISQLITDEHIEFMDHTVIALLRTLLKRQATYTPHDHGDNAAGFMVPSVTIIAGLMVLPRLFQ